MQIIGKAIRSTELTEPDSRIGFRSTDPQSGFWTLLQWKLAIQEARVYLINSNSVSQVIPLPGYYDFVKRVFFHIRDQEYTGAGPLIQADVDQFKSWGFSGELLAGLALLQGIRIEP